MLNCLNEILRFAALLMFIIGTTGDVQHHSAVFAVLRADIELEADITTSENRKHDV